MSSNIFDRFFRKVHFHELVMWAAFLGREFLGRMETQRFCNREGGRVLYVLDTNVLIANAAPTRVGPVSPTGGHGDGACLPPVYPLAHETGLDVEQRAILRDSRYDESRMATHVAEFLSEAVLAEADGTRRDVLKDTTLPPKGSYDVFMFGGHLDERNDTLKLYTQHAKDRTAEATQEDNARRIEGYQQRIKEKVAGQKNKGKQLRVKQLIDKITDKIMQGESMSGIGTAIIAGKFQSIQAHKLDMETFRKLELSEQRQHAGSESEEEQVARSFLHWYFSGKLESKLRWAKRDQGAAHSGERARNFQNDVTCLTELTLMNKRLLDADSRTRIVFVTCDRAMVKAGYLGEGSFSAGFENHLNEYMSAFGLRDFVWYGKLLRRFFEIEPDRSSWFDRFGRHYVHHMHAFAHDEIAEGKDGSLATIFSGMFARQADAIFEDPAKLEHIALGYRHMSPPSDDDADEPYHMAREYRKSVDAWNGLVWRAMRTARVNRIEREQNDTYDAILQLMINHEEANDPKSKAAHVAQAAARINDYLEQMRDKAMLRFSDLGTEFLITEEKGPKPRWVVRNPPDLCFSVLAKTRTMFERLARPHPFGYNNAPVSEFQRDYDRVEQDAEHLEGRNRERLEIYLKFLVMGAAFAAAEKWSVAIGHAEKAIGLVNRTEALGENTILIETENGKAHLSGREAYFLAAVCKKILADHPDKLCEAEEYLKQSRARHLRDIEGGDTTRKAQIELRYIAEELSIAQASYYLTRWTCENGAKGGICDDPGGEACAACHSAFEALEAEADRLWQSPERAHYLKEAEAPSLSDMSMALYVVQLHAIRRRFSAMAACNVPEARGETDWRHPGWLESAVACLDTIEADKHRLMSALARLYRLVGKLMLSPEHLAEGLRDAEDVERLFSDPDLKPVAHFDQWRLNALRLYVEDRVGAAEKVA